MIIQVDKWVILFDDHPYLAQCIHAAQKAFYMLCVRGEDVSEESIDAYLTNELAPFSEMMGNSPVLDIMYTNPNHIYSMAQGLEVVVLTGFFEQYTSFEDIRRDEEREQKKLADFNNHLERVSNAGTSSDS